GDAGADGRAVVGVVDEDVDKAVGVAGHEVARGRFEDDVPAVVADGGEAGVAVGLTAGRAHADAAGFTGHAVVDEHVLHAVGVAGHEVRGAAVEGNESAVAGNGRGEAAAVGLNAAHAQADPRGRAGVHVAQEDVGHAVGVAGHEVAGVALEDQPAAVAG